MLINNHCLCIEVNGGDNGNVISTPQFYCCNGLSKNSRSPKILLVSLIIINALARSIKYFHMTLVCMYIF